MKKYIAFILILLLGLLVGSDQIRILNIVRTPTPQSVSQNEKEETESSSIITLTPIRNEGDTLETISEALTPEPFPDLYNCKIELTFTSGPLSGSKTAFTVLGRDYFGNKGDRFFPGKNTAVYYDFPGYLILHSAFYNGNMLKPLEAEFIRYYLEYWGESGTAYIQGNIDSLIGSTVIWTCNDEPIFTSQIRQIVRLSQVASDELWIEPRNLEQILVKKEGLVSEWVGEMNITSEPTLYLGFCGWGPENSGANRFTYYRYLMNFDLSPAP